MITIDITEDGKFKITKSDNNKYIRKIGTNEIYVEAYDYKDSEYQYEETEDDIYIEVKEEETDETFND